MSRSSSSSENVRRRRIKRDTTGFWYPPELYKLLAATPGYYIAWEDSERFKQLYQSSQWDPRFASDLSICCYQGNFEGVQKLMQANPELVHSESGLSFGYMVQVLLGTTPKFSGLWSNQHARREDLLRYLCELGFQVNHPDLAGFTAISYTVSRKSKLDFSKILLENGANINHRSKFGVPVLVNTLDYGIEYGSFDSIQFLLENGADLCMCDRNGRSGESLYRKCGPKVVAIVENWKKKRLGIEAPYEDYKCVACKEEDKKLRYCGRCGLGRYCSEACQRADWKEHKAACFASLAQKVVVVKPDYDESSRAKTDLSGDNSGDRRKDQGSTRVRIKRSGTNMILKVESNRWPSTLSVTDKRKRFDCVIREGELVLKLGTVLAVQPF